MPTTVVAPPSENSYWSRVNGWLSLNEPEKLTYRDSIARYLYDSTMIETRNEFAQSFLGQMDYYYSRKADNSFTSNCISSCFTSESLSLNTISQKEKKCLRRCEHETRYLKAGLRDFIVQDRLNTMTNQYHVNDYDI